MRAAVQRTRGREDRRLGIAEVEARLGVSRRTIARWVAGGRFPRHHYIGSARRWLVSELEAWEAANTARPPELEQRIANLVGGEGRS